MIQYKRATHDDAGVYRFRATGDNDLREVLNDATDGIVHAFDGGWMTLAEIIMAWDRQSRQDLYEPFYAAPHEVAEWLALLAAEGAIQVRWVGEDGVGINAFEGLVTEEAA